MNCGNASLLVAMIGLICTASFAEEPAKLVIEQPKPFQVVQREGFDPHLSSVNEPGGPELGYTDITVKAAKPKGVTGKWEFQLELLEHGFGSTQKWYPIEDQGDDQQLKGLAEVPAGGWYSLKVRCIDEETITAQGQVEPIGVGEVFIVAGQSYAGGHNDEVMKVTDPSQAVSTYDWPTKTWRIANDPPPQNGDGGSIWPPLGDLLVPTLRVPVAFVNVSVGATSTTKWLPDGPLHKRLRDVGREIGSFRAVLWQQGESDVIEKTSTADYIKNMQEIHDAAAEAWRFNPPWLLAKSTLHPTVYNDPIGERRIRAGTAELWKLPGFRPGPDTDILGGDNRGDEKSKRHFSSVGQKRAALLWFTAIWNELHPTEDRGR